MSKITIQKNETSFTQKLNAKRVDFIKVFVLRIITNCSKYLRKLNGINNYDNADDLEDFSPVILEKDDDKHSTTIKYAIDNPNIQNLALTGPYGSGKSSILKTFENNYLQFKYLNISLATFDEKTLDTEKIEHNILKQLFYSVEHKKIPESRFKRIENQTGIWSKTIFFLIWLISLSYFSKIHLFDSLINTFHINFFSKTLNISYGMYLIFGTVILFHKLMNFVFNFKLTKFKFNDTDFENDQDKKTINFENEIDEILYFFEKTPINVVFIQDLDRFKNKSEIFIKLREINNLINNYEPIKKDRKVTFIYAVSDDVFKEGERAKFFDLIIPVIPIINYTSSSSKLLEKLDLDINEGKLSKDFIDEVSVFLNDYRTIKSIYNEYQIYKKIIGKQLENYNNLLAMMIYKNVEPTDFDKLNSNKGYAYDIIQNSNDLLEQENQNLQDLIDENERKINLVNKENLKSITELRKLYILKFVELVVAQNNYSVFGFYLKNTKCTITDVVSNEFFELFRTQTDIKFYYTNYDSMTASQISFSKIEKAISNINYLERLEIIKNGSKEKLNQIKTELNNFENEKKELNSKKLFEILDKSNSQDYFDKYIKNNEHLNNSRLVNYLLTGGYINEDYNHYISYFHPGTITKEDNDFLISLLPSEKSLAYNHKLKEISSLLNRIKPANYNRNSILNFSLIDYLIENKITDKLNIIVNLLSRGDEKSIKFIDDYLEYASDCNKSDFFKFLLNNWVELWDFVLIKSNFPSEKIEVYLKYIFKYLEIATIEKIDNQKKLSKHISELENLNCFNSDEVNIETVKKFIENSSLKFENLEYINEHRKLFEFIYDKNKYAINEKMIELFITNFNQNETNVENLKTSNYTTIKNSGKAKLIKYIDDNLEEYLQNVFLKLEDNSEESEDNICLILNNESLNSIVEIIENAKFSINDLSKINNIENQSLLIIYEKLNVSWSNLLAYYKKSKEIDETLSGYLILNQNYNILSKKFIDDSDKSIKISFPKDLIKSDITDESFTKLAYSLPFAYDDANEFIGISSSKMKSLIESKRILLSTINYTMINEEFEDLLIVLLEKNIERFMESFEDYTLEGNNILGIINSEVFKPSQKILILESIDDTILLGNKTLLIKLSNFLLANKITKISTVLLTELITNSNSFENKVKLTNQYFSFIDNSELAKIIEKVGEFSKLLHGKHPKVDNVNYNLQLINNLKGKLISNIKNSKDYKQIELFPFKNSRI